MSSSLLAMGVFTLVGAITPGPVNVLALRHGAARSRLVSAAYVLGASASYWTLNLKTHLRADDTLDVFACHGVAGIVGALLTGALAWTTGSGKAVPEQLLTQAVSVVASLLYAGVGSFVLLKLVNVLTPLRVTPVPGVSVTISHR